MKKTCKVINILLFMMMVLTATVIPALGRGGVASADTAGGSGSTGNITSAAFIIGVNQYFANDQAPGITMDAAPYIDTNSGRTLVPVRYLGNALSINDSGIAWNPGAQTVTLTSGSTTISMVIGSTSLAVNGQTKTMDQAPVINNGRTYLPARYVANALGYQVNWDAINKIVVVWPSTGGILAPDTSSLVNLVNIQRAEANGFTIPGGTKLQIGEISSSLPMDFTIDTSVGDVPKQLSDAQYILSQAQFLDETTVAEAMSEINTDAANPAAIKMSKPYNSPSGGCIYVDAVQTGDGGNAYAQIEVQLFSQHIGS
jgi:hypothetical protein